MNYRILYTKNGVEEIDQENVFTSMNKAQKHLDEQVAVLRFGDWVVHKYTPQFVKVSHPAAESFFTINIIQE